MRVATILSAGGSAFETSAKCCSHVDFHVITDRECGAEDVAKSLGIPFTRIEEPNREQFSEKVATELSEKGPFDFVIMLFTRLVSEPLLSSETLLNVHPSLLPAFPGFGAVRNAHATRARVLGATLHVADASTDGGPILAQLCTPLNPNLDLAAWEKASYLQKAALFILAIDLIEKGAVDRSGEQLRLLDDRVQGSDRLNPAITNDKYIEFLREHAESVGMPIF